MSKTRRTPDEPAADDTDDDVGHMMKRWFAAAVGTAALMAGMALPAAGNEVADAAEGAGATESAADVVEVLGKLGDYQRTVDITFPVAGPTHYSDSYEACRSGCSRVHKATDVMTSYGQPVHAARGGTIRHITGLDDDPPSYGYMISIRGDDGLEYNYIHLGRNDGPAREAYAPFLGRGTEVERGQLIGWAGCSGNASCSAPHLHFEIEDPGMDGTDPHGTVRLNPYPSLKAAEARGDYPAPGTGLRPGDAGVALTGDWDGDGVATPAWRVGTTFYLSNDPDGRTVDHEFGYGRRQDLPLAGDWNGSGVDTVGIVRDGTWHLRNRHAGGRSDISFHYGRVTRGDIPLTGDWNGDGRDTAGIVRDGTWHLIDTHRAGPSDRRFVYGRVSRGDVPLVGDWNGDGVDTVAVRRGTTWYLRNALADGRADATIDFGGRRAQPVTGDWNGDRFDGIGVVEGASWYLDDLLAVAAKLR